MISLTKEQKGAIIAFLTAEAKEYTEKGSFFCISVSSEMFTALKNAGLTVTEQMLGVRASSLRHTSSLLKSSPFGYIVRSNPADPSNPRAGIIKEGIIPVEIAEATAPSVVRTGPIYEFDTSVGF